MDWPRGGAAFVEFARLVLGLQGTPGLRRPWVWGRLARRMNRWRSSLADPRVRWAIAALGLAGLVTVLAAWRAGVDLEFLSGLWKTCERFLRTYPWCLFAGLVVLPALPVPTSALLLLAGTVWRSQPAAACGISLLAMSLNMSWTYWVAARPGRGLVEKLLASSALRIPDVTPGNHLRMILLLRLTPGVPLFLQNYVLGFFQVPFRLYLPLSIGCSGMMASGIVLSGAGIADGNLTPALTGLGLIVAAVVVVRALRQRLARKPAA